MNDKYPDKTKIILNKSWANYDYKSRPALLSLQTRYSHHFRIKFYSGWIEGDPERN